MTHAHPDNREAPRPGAPGIDHARVAHAAGVSSHPLALTDAHLRIQWVNDPFAALCASARDDLIGALACDAFGAPGGANEAAGAMRANASRGRGFRGSVLVADPRGRSSWIEVVTTPQRDDAGAVAGFAVCVDDVTESANRWRAEARTQCENEKLTRIARRTTNSIVITDADRRITWANEGFTRISGYTLGEALGKKPAELLQFGKTDPRTIERLREALDAGRHFRGAILNRGKHGQEYWLDLDIHPDFDENGRLTSFMAVQTDITELVEAQQIATKAARESGAILRALDEHSIISIADAEGRIVDVNAGFCAISGYTREEVIGRNHRIINSGDRKSVV